jgi:hypothetical protein
VASCVRATEQRGSSRDCDAAQTIFGHLAHAEGWLFGVLIAALVAWRLLRRLTRAWKKTCATDPED